jgi:hypothetical protein
MARRGQCRCGLVLKFHRTPQGYKMRCPSCGAVVRLRARPKNRALPGPEEFDVELVSLSALADEPLPVRRPWRGWLLLSAAAAVVVLLSAVSGAVWWVMH